MKINLQKELKDFKGVTIKNEEGASVTLGAAITNVLATSQGDPLRAYLLGVQMSRNDKEIELTSNDYQFLKDQFEASKFYHALIKGQVMSILIDAKEKEDTKEKKTK
jgi:hypothetical protein